MKYITHAVCSIILIALLSAEAFPQEQISVSVIASGGARMTGTAFIMTGTVGQPGTGISSSQNNILASGFWSDASNITAADDWQNTTPTEFFLDQNYPNPFNPVTVIKYSVPERSNVTIKIFNITGEEVAVLLNEEKAPGSYELHFDGTKLTSGVYIYRMNSGFKTTSKKMMLLK